MSNRISKSPAWLNDLLRCKQLCAFSPEWVSKCLFKVPASVNDLLHCAQLCDFSPVWVIKCLVKCWDCLNDLLHCECVDLCGCFSHFGRTENGILGTRIKILRPLFNTNLPPKPLIGHLGDQNWTSKSDFWPFYQFCIFLRRFPISTGPIFQTSFQSWKRRPSFSKILCHFCT